MISFEPLQNLMEKPMDRKEFLKHVGAIIVTMVGISAVIRAVSNPLSDVKKMPTEPTKSSRGYGAGTAYGA